MREIAVIGIGQTKVDEHWDKSLVELAGEAALTALADARRESVDGIFFGNMLSGSANHQQHLGAWLADWIGLRYSDAIHIESACSSGGAAFRAGVMAVASGEMESALVVGAEKMTDSPNAEITANLATAADADWELEQGLSFVAINALVMQRYIYEYGWKHSDFSQFSINAHANAVHNPYARFQEPLTENGYQKSPMISNPINLMDASPMGDGAAAIVIVPADTLAARGQVLITVAGSASATDSIAVHSRRDPLWLSAAEKSA
ncbi:MAG TPA: beta-ketoacyl synthase N-terminal-like domain-containing protein, partial [Anaerolineaceae bacterium]